MLIMISINVFLGMVDVASTSMKSESNLFNINQTPAGSMLSGSSINSTFAASYADVDMDVADAVSSNTGTVYTDSMKSINSWWDKLDSWAGIASSFFLQPGGFMKNMDFPSLIYVPFQIIWFIIAGVAFIYLLTGRN